MLYNRWHFNFVDIIFQSMRRFVARVEMRKRKEISSTKNLSERINFQTNYILLWQLVRLTIKYGYYHGFTNGVNFQSRLSYCTQLKVIISVTWVSSILILFSQIFRTEEHHSLMFFRFFSLFFFVFYSIFFFFFLGIKIVSIDSHVSYLFDCFSFLDIHFLCV